MFFNEFKPKKIILLSWDLTNIYRGSSWYKALDGIGVYGHVLPIICEKQNTHFMYKNYISSRKRVMSYKDLAKKILPRYILNKVRIIKKSKKLPRVNKIRQHSHESRAALFINPQKSLLSLMSNMLKKGSSYIYVQYGDTIFTYDGVHLKKIYRFKHNSDKMCLNSSVKEIDKNVPVDWLVGVCNGYNTAPFFLQVVSDYIQAVFPLAHSLIDQYYALYRKISVTDLYTYSLGSDYEYPAIAAAKLLGITKHGALHGCDAYNCPSRFFTEFRYYESYYVGTLFEVKNLNRLRKKFCDYAFVSSANYKVGKNIGQLKINSSGKKVPDKEKMILYVPVLRKYRNNTFIGDPFKFTLAYEKWHTNLLSLFSTYDEFTFVWKAYAHPDFGADTVQKIISDADYSNVVYRSDDLTKYISDSSSVIFDVPSTAFFDVVQFHHNTLCLNIGDSGYLCNSIDDVFRQHICDFLSYEDCILKVKNHLDSLR